MKKIKLEKTRAAFLDPRNLVLQLQKHFSKSMSLWSPNKGSNRGAKILAYKKNKLYLISILYIKNINEEYFFGSKAHARDVLSMF